jgi:TRAP-type C4-dicarboxylate transport system substrate-binding protein
MRERREENRAAMREHWESLSEEERAALREKRRQQQEKRRETWNNMSDEEKAAAREHMRERRDQMGDKPHKKRHPPQ